MDEIVHRLLQEHACVIAGAPSARFELTIREERHMYEDETDQIRVSQDQTRIIVKVYDSKLKTVMNTVSQVVRRTPEGVFRGVDEAMAMASDAITEVLRRDEEAIQGEPSHHDCPSCDRRFASAADALFCQALDGYEETILYKSEYLRAKHGDDDEVSYLKKVRDGLVVGRSTEPEEVGQ